MEVKTSQGGLVVLRRTLGNPGGTLTFKERLEGGRKVHRQLGRKNQRSRRESWRRSFTYLSTTARVSKFRGGKQSQMKQKRHCKMSVGLVMKKIWKQPQVLSQSDVTKANAQGFPGQIRGQEEMGSRKGDSNKLSHKLGCEAKRDKVGQQRSNENG